MGWTLPEILVGCKRNSEEFVVKNNIVLTCFLRNMFNHYLLLFILINGAVQPQRNVELVGYNCAGEIPTICKIQTERNGSYHSSSHRSKFCRKTICFRSRILFSRNSALQSGIHRDEMEGTSIDDEFTEYSDHSADKIQFL